MLNKSIYAIQPYEVGHKDRKSLAIIIPARIAKEYNINSSTIFTIQIERQQKSIVLHMIDMPHRNDCIDHSSGVTNNSCQIQEAQ